MVEVAHSSRGTIGQTIGKGAGYLVGILGLLTSIIVLFVPLGWIVYGNIGEMTYGAEFLLGNEHAGFIFIEGTLLLLLSISIIYIVWTEGNRVLWLMAGIFGISGIGEVVNVGSLSYGNQWVILCTTAILLAISAAFLTFSPVPDK